MRIQAIAQNGLAYCQNAYDIERYQQLRALAAEILARYTEAPLDALTGLFAAETGYATPKLDMRAAVFQDGRILLVNERADGRWTLPGGWVDIGESPSEAVEREVWEESGYRVKAVKLLAVFDRNRHGHEPYPFHTYKLFFGCQVTGGAAADSLETSGAAFFDRAHLPPLSLTRTSPDEIATLFAHHDDPHRPADFD
jgi:ADP-ribose pyrophosphatase YjhB (NUDIX family)